jgi:hypothetical protein
MALKVIITVAAALFAIGGFLGAGPTEGGPLNPFGWLFVGLAIVIWFNWAAIGRILAAAEGDPIIGTASKVVGRMGFRRNDPSSRRSPASS